MVGRGARGRLSCLALATGRRSPGCPGSGSVHGLLPMPLGCVSQLDFLNSDLLSQAARCLSWKCLPLSFFKRLLPNPFREAPELGLLSSCPSAGKEEPVAVCPTFSLGCGLTGLGWCFSTTAGVCQSLTLCPRFLLGGGGGRKLNISSLPPSGCSFCLRKGLLKHVPQKELTHGGFLI